MFDHGAISSFTLGTCTSFSSLVWLVSRFAVTSRHFTYQKEFARNCFDFLRELSAY